jgi:hypothetical protein
MLRSIVRNSVTSGVTAAPIPDKWTGGPLE